MSESIWNDSKKTMVFYDQGKFAIKVASSDGTNLRMVTNKPKLAQAPFSVVNLSTGGTALVPRDTPLGGGCSAYATTSDVPSDASRVGDGEFFYDGSVLTMGEHEMGDHEGHPNDWKGVHKFSKNV